MCACRTSSRGPAGPVVPAGTPPVRRVAEPAGEVVDGRFVDAEGGFSIAGPDGWQVRIGPRTGERRVVLTDPDTGLRVEIWRLPETLAGLAPRPECIWTFDDHGPYRDLPIIDAQTVGTCMPEDPIAPRIQAWLVERGGANWQVELHLPGARMLEARRTGLAVLATARWGF